MKETKNTDVTSQIYAEELKKIWQISLLIELYCDQKKVLKQIKKIVATEKKRVKNSRFTQTERVLGEVVTFLEDTELVVKSFLSVKTTEDFNRAKKGLQLHLSELDEKLNPRGIVQDVKDVIGKAKDKVKNITELAVEKLEKLKNSVCERKDDHSESV